MAGTLWVPNLPFSLFVGVLAPDLVALELTKQGEGDVLRLAWLDRQRHIGLLGSTAALAVVAVTAGRHHVLPGCLATARARQDVIDGQVGATRLSPAVLAGLTIASQNAAARAGQPHTARNLDITHQPDDQRNIEEETLRAEALLGCLNQFGLLLEKQNNCTPSRDKLKRLVACVEDENALSQEKPPFQSRTSDARALARGTSLSERSTYNICGAGDQHRAGAPHPIEEDSPAGGGADLR